MSEFNYYLNEFTVSQSIPVYLSLSQSTSDYPSIIQSIPVYQGGSRSFHLFRNFSKILKSRWKMPLKKLVDRGYFCFIFSIFIVFLLTNIFNFCKKSLKFRMFKFLSLIFGLFTKNHWKSRWFSKNFFRNFPEFRQSTTSLVFSKLKDRLIYKC